jgi:hypothetical protein
VETQLPLFPAAARPAAGPLEDAFRRLASHVKPRIVYAAARRRIFSWRADRAEDEVVVHVGTEFRRAPPNVAEALVRIVTRRRLPRDVRRQHFFEIRRWVTEFAPEDAAAGRCRPPQGRYVDLSPILDAVRSRHFTAPVAVRIGWSERPARNLMGRFERGTPEGLIVVNRLLDSPLTPPWYLDFLVFHELLHAVIPPRPGSSRLLIHPPEFRRIEREHPQHARAKHFERWAAGTGFRILSDPDRRDARIPARFQQD